jgi:hypothetical protein
VGIVGLAVGGGRRKTVCEGISSTCRPNGPDADARFDRRWRWSQENLPRRELQFSPGFCGQFAFIRFVADGSHERSGAQIAGVIGL